MTLTEHDLDELLAAADPVRAVGTGFEVPAARDMLRLVSGGASRRRVARRRVAVAVVAGVTLTSGVAAATWTSSRTGLFGAGGQTENDTTEFLDPRGDDFAQVVAALGRGIPFPPGDGPLNYLRQVSPPDGIVQESGVRLTLTLDAACAWTGLWLDARARNDAAAASNAASVLANRSLWPSVGRDVDDLLASVGRDAAAGRAGMPQQYWDANCTSLPREWAGR